MNPATLFFTAALSALYLPASVAEAGTTAFPQYITDTVPANTTSDKPESSNIRALYETYQARLNAIGTKSDISGNGFDIVESQIFPFEPEILLEPVTESGLDTAPEPSDVTEAEPSSGLSVIPAFDRTYHRLALFLADADGTILYRTDQLETNNSIRGQMKQPKQEIASVAFQDLNGDLRTDIILITVCEGADGRRYKVGMCFCRAQISLAFTGITGFQTSSTALA